MRTNAAGVNDLSPVVVVVPARSAKRQGLRWFVRAPARMALDRGLSAVAFRLGTVLLHYEGELGCFPSQERLSDDLGISVDSVQRYLRELELYGFLIVEKRGRRNNYRLEPIYEAPIEHGSIEETGQLEIENQQKRQPPSPRTLRSRTVVATRAEEGTSQKAAPVRPVKAFETIESTASVRSVNAAPLRPEIVERPHQCGTNKNQSNIENQQQQEAGQTDVGGHLQEKHDITGGIAALQRVGVNIVASDLGSHGGRGRSLLDVELLEWVAWIQSPERNGIAKKHAFAASKIRNGFTVADAFPDFLIRGSLDRQQQLSSVRVTEAEDAAEQLRLDRIQQADTLIASLDAKSRQDLRAKALNDPAAWIGRNGSPDIFDRIVMAVERRIVLAETRQSDLEKLELITSSESRN